MNVLRRPIETATHSRRSRTWVISSVGLPQPDHQKSENNMNKNLDPSNIMQTATGFWASKILLTAVEFDLFTTLGDGSKTAAVADPLFGCAFTDGPHLLGTPCP
jgi:hypothetical protein